MLAMNGDTAMSHAPTPVLDQVAGQLRAEVCRIVAAKTQLQGQIDALDDEVKRLRAALVALGNKKRSVGQQEKPSPKALTTCDVVALVESVLSACDGMNVIMLRAEIERRIRSNGGTLIGFHLRFAKALKDLRFHIDKDDCRLARVHASSESVSR